MKKIVKTDIENAEGLKNFLIPVQMLPDNVELGRTGRIYKLSVTGQTVEIEGQKFLKVDHWQILR